MSNSIIYILKDGNRFIILQKFFTFLHPFTPLELSYHVKWCSLRHQMFEKLEKFLKEFDKFAVDF